MSLLLLPFSLEVGRDDLHRLGGGGEGKEVGEGRGRDFFQV